jgi:hypothetical protein
MAWLASARPAGVVSRAGVGCILRDRSFFPQFKSRRQPEDHWGPRSVAVLHHRELTERTIGLAIEMPRHGRPGSFKSFYAVALCRELERVGIRVRREVGIPAIYIG